MGKSITPAMWADIEKNWKEWFPNEELPLGGKCKYWALSYRHKFQVGFILHDVLCQTRNKPLTPEIPIKWADKWLDEIMITLSYKTINWSKKTITNTPIWQRLWLLSERKTFKFLITGYH